MKWKDEFSIGIETIDKQHRKIFEHLLALENSITKRDPWHMVRFFIQEVRDYLEFHLSVEEALLEITGYPEADAHIAAHAQLKVAITELEDKIKNIGSANDLVSFFETWFLCHVLSADRSYAAHVSKSLARQHAAET